MICSKDISVVIQGPVKREYITQCVDSIKRLLPESEIILSCWEGEDISEIIVNKIILNKDPGTDIQNKHSGIMNNINRQIVSTIAGIEQATGKFVLKMRTDICLLGTEFLQEYDGYPKRTDEMRYFNNRLMICSYYSRNPRIIDVPYHYSDWICFGLKEDVKKFYNVPLQDKQEAQWFLEHEKRTKLYKNYLCRYGAEQHLSLYGVKRVRDIQCDNYYDNSKPNIIGTEEYLVNNFIIFDYKDTTIRFLKYNPNRYGDSLTLYDSSDWKLLYKKYITKDAEQRAWFCYLIKCRIKRWVCRILYEYISVMLDKIKCKNQMRFILTRLSEKRGR